MSGGNRADGRLVTPDLVVRSLCWGAIGLAAVYVVLRLLYVRWRGAPPRPPRPPRRRSASGGGLDDHAGGGND